jgi:hypothetical protein
MKEGLQPVPVEFADAECKRLREENVPPAAASGGTQYPNSTDRTREPPAVKPVLLLEDKKERARKRVALFRNLLHGREDVYARRWESPDGRSGYTPAAQKDWKAINRSGPEDRKKVDQKTRKFFPLTDAVIENHLLGNETVCVYPLLPDETCWFLAVDFDKKTWQEDSRAFTGSSCSINGTSGWQRS